MDIIFLSLILGGSFIIYYFYLSKSYAYWRKQAIPCPTGILPGLGHMWPVISLKVNFVDFVRQIYEQYPDRSMVGFYNKTTPALVICEPELVKTIMQTNFANFSANQLKIDPYLDPLLALNAFFSNGDVWFTSRKRLAFAFSNMRLKLVFNHIEHACKKLEDYLDRKLEKIDMMEIELKDLCSRYTGEVVAKAGFSLESASFEDELDPASFHAIGNLLFKSNFQARFSQILNFFLPEFNRIFRMSFVPRQVDRFFHKTVKEIMQIRQKKDIRKNDFIQLMIDLEKLGAHEFGETQIVAHVFTFFLDTYETTSITLSFIGYHLARHPRVQQKLRDEVEDVLAKHGGCVTYESLKDMCYMNQVISESQRLHTAVGAMGKVCTNDIVLTGPDGLCCNVQRGTEIIIPVHALHRDPKYWPDPDIFDPERFAADKVTEIQKHTFQPFGEGPRTCVGMKLGLLMIKTCLAMLIRNYALEISPKTKKPLKMLSGNFLSTPVGGLWVYIKRFNVKNKIKERIN